MHELKVKLVFHKTSRHALYTTSFHSGQFLMNSSIPISQLGPSNPSAQLHVKLTLSILVQVAPFKQGEVSHGLIVSVMRVKERKCSSGMNF